MNAASGPVSGPAGGGRRLRKAMRAAVPRQCPCTLSLDAVALVFWDKPGRQVNLTEPVAEREFYGRPRAAF